MSSIKNISLFIPHIFAVYDEELVKEVFEREVGKVSRVDFVAKIGKNGAPYNAAYVHFEYWYETDTALQFQERVTDPNTEARILYHSQWYWIVLENTAKKFAPGQRKTRIDIGDASLALVTPTKQNTNITNIPGAPKKHNTKNCELPYPIALADRFTEGISVMDCTEEDPEDLEYLRTILNIDDTEINMQDIARVIDQEELKNIQQYAENLEKENEYLKAEVQRLHRIILNNPPQTICEGLV